MAARGIWLLNSQGRVQGDLMVWRENDELELNIAADQYEKLMEHLDRFIIMDDVELAPLSGETAIGLTGSEADEVLGRLSLPTLSEPLTGTRVEWNGLALRIVRGYGVLALHYELWVPLAGLGKLWLGLRTAAATPVERLQSRRFGLPKGFRRTGLTLWSGIWRRRPRRCGRCTSTRGATWGRRLWSGSDRGGMFTSICCSLSFFGPVPAGGTALHFDDGALDGETAAGHITSALNWRWAGSRLARSSSAESLTGKGAAFAAGG